MKFTLLLIALVATQPSSGLMIRRFLHRIQEITRNLNELQKKFFKDASSILSKGKVTEKLYDIDAEDETPAIYAELRNELQDVVLKVKEHYHDEIPDDLRALISNTKAELDQQIFQMKTKPKLEGASSKKRSGGVKPKDSVKPAAGSPQIGGFWSTYIVPQYLMMPPQAKLVVTLNSYIGRAKKNYKDKLPKELDVLIKATLKELKHQIALFRANHKE